jgi:NitT/TauT family transport system ATP-binding protein
VNAPAVRIRFDNVGVEFPTAHGPMRVLDGVSFDVCQGEFVSIIGPSGCGKTTLMNMVGGFLTPTSGQVLLDGRPVKGPGPDRGVIFQEYGVFPWLSVRGNIEFGLKVGGRKVSQQEIEATTSRYMKLMGLADFANHYPKHLSGGMRQRLAIARAYAVKPQFLLMDEPFGALDEITRIEMQEELLRVWSSRRKTVLFVTHSITEALMLSDRIVVMRANPGGIAAEYRIDQPRPRSRSDAALAALHEQLWAQLR